MSSLGLSVCSFVLATSLTSVSAGSRLSATPRIAMSRSVRIPRGALPSVTITSPMSLSRISRAASWSVACGSTVATSVAIMSATWDAIGYLLLVAGICTLAGAWAEPSRLVA